MRSDRLGGERRGQGGDRLETRDVVGQSAELDQSLRDDDVDEGEEQERVGAGPDRVVLVRDLGGARAARVDHDDLAPTRPDSLEPASDVRGGHQRSVGHQRIRTEHEEVLGAVEVRDRDGHGVAEQITRGEVLWQLVDASGGVDVVCPDGAVEGAAVEHDTEVVRRRVAQVERDGVRAVCGDHRHEAVGDLLERLVPGHRLPLPPALDHRLPEAVGVLLQRFEGSAFGTDEAAGEGILVVAANRADRLPHERHPKTTRRLTERAGDVGRAHGRGRPVPWSSSCSLSHLVI